MSNYGILTFTSEEDRNFINIHNKQLESFIFNHAKLRPFFSEKNDGISNKLEFDPLKRGHLKLELIKIGFPVCDMAGYRDGESHEINLADDLRLRGYQTEAVDSFGSREDVHGGSGVLVLPCGAGKTVIGISVMAQISMKTLILVTNVSSAKQWRNEILSKTTLSPDDVAIYSGEEKSIAPITIATYQILTTRKTKESDFIHMGIFTRAEWGLVIYDEVHLLPAPIFKSTASIQACRRLGLTATLVREDKKEDEVFSLIGPKKFDVPWKVLEESGWIANASCYEVRVPLSEDMESAYPMLDSKEQFKIASVNKNKTLVVKNLLEKHNDDKVLILGMYVDQIRDLAIKLDIPIIDGSTKQKERYILYQAFRDGKIKRLIISKVGNFSIDLPDASVAIQISGTFGSRQEEAQRLGRILRPKKGNNKAFFYTVITDDSEESRFALNRQLFLVEQGYDYNIVSESFSFVAN